MFYMFRQNNSGGGFDNTEDLDVHVVIEAKNEEDCIVKAKSIGIYFDGVEAGIDCECCGDRWADNTSNYNTLEEIFNEQWSYMEGRTIVHFMDGTKTRR